MLFSQSLVIWENYQKAAAWTQAGKEELPAAQLLCVSSLVINHAGDGSEKSVYRHLAEDSLCRDGKKETIILSRSYMGSSAGIIQWCLGVTAMHLQLKKKKILFWRIQQGRAWEVALLLQFWNSLSPTSLWSQKYHFITYFDKCKCLRN